MLKMIKSDALNVYVRGEDYVHRVRFRIDDTTSDVSGATMNVHEPCDDTDNLTTMTRIALGTYEGVYSIPTDANYGEYGVTVTAVAEGRTSIFTDAFYVLPWAITEHVRKISGVKESKDITDDDLATIVWYALLEVREDVFKMHHAERLQSTDDYCFDGTNTTFYVNRNIMTDLLFCHEEAVTGYAIGLCGERLELDITVEDATLGEVSITCLDGSPLTSYTCQVYVSYMTYSDSYDDQLIKKAVTYLAAHELILRFHELDKATLADLHSNSPMVIANPDRMLKHYKSIVRKIGECKYGGV